MIAQAELKGRSSKLLQLYFFASRSSIADLHVVGGHALGDGLHGAGDAEKPVNGCGPPKHVTTNVARLTFS
jgi:hypothetical protein